MAVMGHDDDSNDPMPIVETTKEVIKHYNKRNMAGFEKAGYFILRDVIVCEHGHADEVRKKLSKDLDSVVLVAPIGAEDHRPKK